MRRTGGPLLVTAGTFGSAAAQWFLVWLFARAGGTDAVGQFTSLLALATPLFIAAQFGLRNVYLTLAERHPFRRYLALRLAGVAVGSVALVALGAALGFPAGLLAAMTLMKAADALLDLAYARLQSGRRLLALGVLMVANPVATVAAASVAVAAGGDVTWGVAASALASVATLAVGAVLVAGQAPPPAASDHAGDAGRDHGAPALLRAAAPVMATQLLVSLLTYLPVWVARAGGGESASGVYAGASYLVVFAQLVGASLQTVILPAYRDARDAGADLWATARRSLVLLTALGTAAGILAVVAGPAVLAFVYGPSFVVGRMALALLALAAVAALPTSVLNALMLVHNRYGRQAWVTAAAVVVGALAGATAVLGGWPAVTAACASAAAGALVRLVGGWLEARAGAGRGVAEQESNGRAAHTR